MYLCLQNLWLKQKRRMLYFSMDFGGLTIDGLIDTGALSGAIPEADFNKIRLSATKAIIEEIAPLDFHIIVANGGIEQPGGTVITQLKVGDFRVQRAIHNDEKFDKSTDCTLVPAQKQHPC